jgi:hypothetical protein
MKISVSKVLSVSPPINVIAKGAPIFVTYSVLAIARGIRAITVVIVVIKTGRIRANPDVSKALDCR